MQVNDLLRRMRASDSRDKGYYGEQAVLSIALDVANRIGGSVYHSFRFLIKKEYTVIFSAVKMAPTRQLMVAILLMRLMSS